MFTPHLLPALRNEGWPRPEGLEDFGVKTDVTRLFETAETFFTLDRDLVGSEHSLESDLAQVDLSERNRSLILLDDRPAYAKPFESNQVKGGGAIDLKQILSRHFLFSSTSYAVVRQLN